MSKNTQHPSKKDQPTTTEPSSHPGETAWISKEMEAFLNNTEVAAIFLDNTLHIRYFNQRAVGLFSLVAESIGDSLLCIENNLDYDSFCDDVRAAVKTAECIEKQIPTKDGQYWFTVRIMPYYIQEDVTGLVTITLLDTTQNKQLELNLQRTQQELMKSKGDFEQMFLLSTHMVCIVTPEGLFKKVSPAFTETFGYSSEDYLEKVFISFIHPDDRESSFETLAPISMGVPLVNFSNRYRCKDGSYRWLEWSARSFVKGGNIYAIAYDITKHRSAEEKLKHNAHYDALTSLPNRVLLTERLNSAMLECQRNDKSLAVAYLDLDGFKNINDTHGHAIGDELLATLSQRMRLVLREKDTLARVGGDEFIAVMMDVGNVEDSEPILNSLLDAASQDVVVDGIVLQVSASIGITFYPQADTEAGQLIRQADYSMYTAKQAGKNRYNVFDTDYESAVKVQHETIDDVRHALVRNELVLHYQPKVNIRSGEVIGAEALIRWSHPTRGFIYPLAFLPAIENHDVSVELGEWVIESALSQIQRWQAEGINIPVSINISAYQLLKPNFTDRLGLLLDKYPEVKPDSLELEVLETSSLHDINRASAVMTACKQLGVRFALDDFGTGYSSLTYLKRLPAYMIKIDQSFVREMLTNTEDLAIVKGVVGLAEAFQLSVIAEGVETAHHRTALLDLGCELAQGFGIAKPMPANDISKWMTSWEAEGSWC